MAHDVSAQYLDDGLEERVLAAMREAGLDPDRLDPEALVALDEFHSMGRDGTVALAELAAVRPADRVLDLGAGLGGPARRLARTVGCHVTALDLTPAFCRLSVLLTRLTGLEERVTVCQGDAVDVPFADGSFDVVWTQHAAMNIPDKPRLYREARRLLAPGGRLALYDVLRGDVEPVHFPVPWARDAGASFLPSPDELAAMLAEAGFATAAWQDVTAEVTAWTVPRAGPGAPPPPPISLARLLAADMPERYANYARSLREGRVRVVRALLRPTGPV